MQPADGAAREIVRLAEARGAALVQQDQAAMERLLADTFRYTNASGAVLSKAEYIEHYVASTHMRWTEQALDEVEVVMYGQAAVLTCRVHDVGRYGDEPFDAFYRSTFTWVLDGGAWRCAAGHTTETERPSAAA
jgi:hypothetical protein